MNRCVGLIFADLDSMEPSQLPFADYVKLLDSQSYQCVSCGSRFSKTLQPVVCIRVTADGEIEDGLLCQNCSTVRRPRYRRNPTTPIPKEPICPAVKVIHARGGKPSIPYDRAIKLLSEQIEKGRRLQNHLPLLLGDFDQWDNSTKRIVELAFGENDPNIEHFAVQESPSTHGSWGIDQWSAHYKEALHLKISALLGYIDQLNVLKSIQNPSDLSEPMGTPAPSNKIFIVHGHNDALKYETAHSLQSAGLDVTILHEAAHGGRTLPEKLINHAGEVGFAVVLLTADDLGGARGGPSASLQPRARQNVVFEFGLFVGLLGRGKVCALYEPGVELPSDLHGFGRVEHDSAGRWKIDVAKEIAAAGIKLDFSKL